MIVPEPSSRYQAYGWPAPQAAADWELSILVPPSMLFGSNGMRVDAAGRLWITQASGDQICSYDPGDGRLRIECPVGSIGHPDDIAFDGTGVGYVTQPGLDSVSRLARDGSVSLLIGDCPAANGITTSADGRLFVDECRPGGRLLEILPGPPPVARVVVPEIDRPNALEMGADGRLYVPEVGANRVIAVDPASGAVDVILEGVQRPSAVKFDARGRLVVSESATGRLHWLDQAAGTRGVLVDTEEVGTDNFAFDSDGGVYVSNFVSGSLRRFEVGDGRQTTVINDGYLLGPYGMCPFGTDAILVADSLSIALVATAEGGLRRLCQVPNNQPFAAVAVGRAGESIFALAREGQLWLRPVSRTDFAGPVALPAELASRRLTALAGAGHALYVGDDGGHITTLDPQGSVVATTTSGLDSVTAVTAGVGPSPLVAACQQSTGRVVLDVLGRRRALEGFAEPAAVAVTTDAAVVVELGHRSVVRVDLESGQRTTLATDLPFGSPAEGGVLYARPSVVVLDDGSVVLGCEGDGSIRRLARR